MERRNVQEEMPGSSGENGWKISCGGSLDDDVLVSHTWHRITLLPNQNCDASLNRHVLPHTGFNPLYSFRMISQNLLKTLDASMGFVPGYSDNEQVPRLRALTCKSPNMNSQ